MEINKIYNMDCLEGMKQLEDNSVHLVVTDPPYNFSLRGGLNGQGIAAKREIFKNIDNSFGSSFSPKFLNEIPRIMKKINLFVYCNKILIKEYLDFAYEWNLLYDVLIWHKPNPIPTKQGHHLSDIEYCIYMRDPGSYFNNDLPFKYYKKVQTFDSPKSAEHPTVKPIELIRRLISIGSKENNLVLDPFMGSGTTAVACKQLNRMFIGFEINPKYVEIANRRLEQKQLWRTLT